MNDYLFAALVSVGSFPAASIILKLIFKKSFMFRISRAAVILALLVSFDMYLVGVLGQIHILWVLPLNFGVGIGIFLLIRKTISNPINRSIDKVLQLSEGQLDMEIEEVQGSDEVARLNNALFHHVEALNRVLSEIQITSEQLNNSSIQLSAIAEELSGSASEQASNIEEVSSTFEEISNVIADNISKSKMTGEMTEQVMESINGMLNGLRAAMKTYGEISEKINGVSNIAFQTNILALNAAVEAARAGEHGKGFAVVADEVQKLASESKKLASEVNTISQSNQKDSETAGKDIARLIPELEKTSVNVQDLVQTNIESGGGIQQLNASLHEMNNTTQQNAASSEEMASSAEELSAQAESLKQLLAQFTLKK